MALIPLVVQKNTITVNKVKQLHTRTPKYMWFPQFEVRSQVEVVTKKFTNQRWITKNSEEKTTQNPKHQYIPMSLSHKRGYSPQVKTKVKTSLLLG